MAFLNVTYTTQYDGIYYSVVHDQLNNFVVYSTGETSTDSSSVDRFVIKLSKKEFNTYSGSVPAEKLNSGVYTFRVYKQNGNSPNILIDDLVSVGQTGWNSFTQSQTNASDIIGAIETYESRMGSIHRIEIYMDSIQLGLRNNESGFVKIDYDDVTLGLKIDANWRVGNSVTINRFSIRGPVGLGSRANPIFNSPVSESGKFSFIGSIDTGLSSILKAKNFYVTLDTSSQLNGRIGGYPIYTPTSVSTASGSVSVGIFTSAPSTGVSFRTR